MPNYNAVSPAIVKELRQIVGEKNVIVDPDKLIDYSHDEVSDSSYYHMPEVVVFPEKTEQIAAVLGLANSEMIPVVPRGAGTGLACGAVPLFGGIVITLEKMNRIVKVDQENLYIVAEAGVRTDDLQKAAAEVGLLYAGDPCSGDSCFIGGNVATNAGGNKAVKYGTTRQQVYELEVVTPKGGITKLGGRLHKSTTGYSLEQLIIGSEGTLGIITKVTLKLIPMVKNTMDILAVFPDIDSAIGIVYALNKAGIKATCLEFMDNNAIKSVEGFLNEKLPHSENGYYMIIQLDGNSEEELEALAVDIDELCEANGSIEVLVADSQKIWKARKAYGEAAAREKLVNGTSDSSEDIVVPIDTLPRVIRKMLSACEKRHAIARIASHAGDGNVHLTILQGAIPKDQWLQKLAEIQQDILDFVYPLGGKLSGEHGIGYKRKALMQKYTDPIELEMMREIKKALDPNLILNPGKLFDLE